MRIVKGSVIRQDFDDFRRQVQWQQHCAEPSQTLSADKRNNGRDSLLDLPDQVIRPDEDIASRRFVRIAPIGDMEMGPPVRPLCGEQQRVVEGLIVEFDSSRRVSAARPRCDLLKMQERRMASDCLIAVDPCATVIESDAHMEPAETIRRDLNLEDV
jgi:hypothetical protein